MKTLVKGRRRAAKTLDRRRRRGSSLDFGTVPWPIRERAKMLMRSGAAAVRRLDRALEGSDERLSSEADDDAKRLQMRYLFYARPLGLA